MSVEQQNNISGQDTPQTETNSFHFDINHLRLLAVKKPAEPNSNEDNIDVSVIREAFKNGSIPQILALDPGFSVSLASVLYLANDQRLFQGIPLLPEGGKAIKFFFLKHKDQFPQIINIKAYGKNRPRESHYRVLIGEVNEVINRLIQPDLQIEGPRVRHASLNRLRGNSVSFSHLLRDANKERRQHGLAQLSLKPSNMRIMYDNNSNLQDLILRIRSSTNPNSKSYNFFEYRILHHDVEDVISILATIENAPTVSLERNGQETKNYYSEVIYPMLAPLTGIDDPSFDDIYKVVYLRTFRFFYSKVHDALTSEDLSQEVMINLLQVVSGKRGEFSSINVFNAYVDTCCRNQLYKHWKAVRKSPTEVEIIDERVIYQSEDFIEEKSESPVKEMSKPLANAISSIKRTPRFPGPDLSAITEENLTVLTEQEKVVFQYYQRGLSCGHVAELLSNSENRFVKLDNVKNRLKRAKRKLTLLLNQSEIVSSSVSLTADLTLKEERALYLASQGFKYKEIAKILSKEENEVITKRAVSNRIFRARLKTKIAQSLRKDVG